MNVQSAAATYLRPDPGTFNPAVGGALLAQTFGMGVPPPAVYAAPGQGSTPYPSFGTTGATSQRGPSPMEGQTAPTPAPLIPIYAAPSPTPPPPSTLQNYIPIGPAGPSFGPPQPVTVSAPAPAPAPSSSSTLPWLAAGAAILALLYLGNEDKKKGRKRR